MISSISMSSKEGLQQKHLPSSIDSLSERLYETEACYRARDYVVDVIPIFYRSSCDVSRFIDKRWLWSIPFFISVPTFFTSCAVALTNSFNSGWAVTLGTSGAGTVVTLAGLGIHTKVLAYKVKQLKLLAFKSQYEPSALIEPQDIMSLMKVQDQDFRRELIEKMNFKQLYFVRQALTDREFQKIMRDQCINTEALNVWRSILAGMPSIKTLKDLENKLKEYVVRVHIQKDPFVGTVMCEIWKNIYKQDIASIDTCSQIFLFLKETPTSEEEVTFEVPNCGLITANRSLLVQNSEFFEKLLAGKMQESKQKTIKIEESEDFETFEKFIKILNHKPIPLDPELILKLMALANKYCVKQLFTSLDAYMAMHPHLFSEEDFYDLAKTYRDLKNLRAFLEKKWVNQKLTVGNWEKSFYKGLTNVNLMNSRKNVRVQQ